MINENKDNSLILIVDDNRKNLKLLGELLKEQGYRVAVAENGVKALTAVNTKQQPDLILLDIVMPKMSGFETCKTLKINELTKNIPVIFLTSRTDKKDVIEGLKLGAVDYVTKPFSTDELLIRIKTHLDLKKAKSLIVEQKHSLEKANIALEQTNNAKDKFFSIVTNDLNDLFSSLLSISDVLTTRTVKLYKHEREDFITIIQEYAQQGFTLLRNLFEWSKIQTGKVNFEPESLNLRALVDSNLKITNHEVEARMKNISLTCIIPDYLFVFADSNMVDTIIRNLVSNAIKFTPEYGKITINAREKDNLAHVSISDTGMGIATKDIESLFKIDVSHTTGGTSSLGLILCKELVEKNGGSLWITSKEWAGTTVYFTVPVA
jgi:two-component system sensor histidine kinase/response regulator